MAGTIPVRSVNASATLARSEGHHPAGYRTAIPTRVYESGSGAAAAAHAVPVRHPFPARPPPRQENTGPMPRTPDHRLAGPGVKGACGVAARALRAPGPRRRLARPGSDPGPWARQARPHSAGQNHRKPLNQARTRHRKCKPLTGPLHMRSDWREPFGFAVKLAAEPARQARRTSLGGQPGGQRRRSSTSAVPVVVVLGLPTVNW